MQDQMREGHIQRLIDKKCQVEAGIIFLDSVSDYERISDHAETGQVCCRRGRKILKGGK